jgi:hypothetical protein
MMDLALSLRDQKFLPLDPKFSLTDPHFEPLDPHFELKRPLQNYERVSKILDGVLWGQARGIFRGSSYTAKPKGLLRPG